MPAFRKAAPRLCLAAAAMFALSSAVCLYLALTQTYDAVLRHFTAGSVPAAAAAILCVAGALTAAAAGILCACARCRLSPAPPSGAAALASTLTAFLLLASFIWSIRASAGEPLSPLLIVRLVLMALSAAYFLLLSSEKASGTTAFAFLSLLPILYAFFSVLAAYFSGEYGMNAPVKSYDLMMYLSMALFFTGEARVALKRTQSPSYLFFALLCFVLCTAVGGSHLVIALHDTLGHGFSLTDSAVSLSVALFAAARVFSLQKEPEVMNDTQPAQGKDGTDES